MTSSPTGWPGGTSADPDGAPAPSGRGVAVLGDGPDTSRTTSEAADLADRVAAAALAAPGVVSLHGGSLGEVATLLPGRRVRGVRLDGPDGGTQVHVVATTTTPIPTTAQAVRAAVGAVVDGPVHVVVGDVATPAEQAGPAEPAPAPGA
ncbi:hypothetical protein WDZ17_00690 [Pseudokineococcus basanitobsidens]|uniref:Asp23/Gls24 family envelope stress response protein n=1 Tax=Pseudokineococcus basanitobsidens TaxID=1926649 RepID=A0ABU8RFJ6_9ACTN